MATYAGRVYRRAFRSAKLAARLHGHSLAAEYNWREDGGPVFRELSRSPWLLEVFLAVVKAQHGLDKLTRPELEQRATQLESKVATACLEVLRLTHTTTASADEKAEARLNLSELLAEQQGVQNEIERRPPAKGH